MDAAGRDFVCGDCGEPFNTQEPDGYVGMDHLLDNHRELFDSTAYLDVELRHSAISWAVEGKQDAA
jgi:hypothetical protein